MVLYASNNPGGGWVPNHVWYCEAVVSDGNVRFEFTCGDNFGLTDVILSNPGAREQVRQIINTLATAGIHRIGKLFGLDLREI